MAAADGEADDNRRTDNAPTEAGARRYESWATAGSAGFATTVPLPVWRIYGRGVRWCPCSGRHCRL
jgi:hypothetical protein